MTTPTPRARRAALLCALALCLGAHAPSVRGQTGAWLSRGVGGGGALFSPSINPSNVAEYYVACDMSGLYHTADFGASYALADFRTLQGGHDARVQFTADPAVLYCITYANDMALPAGTTDGGKTWFTLPGDPDPSEPTYAILADYTTPSRVIIGTYGSILSSADGGKTFATVHTAASSGAGVNIGGAYFDGNVVYLGTNDGLLRSTNGGASFSVLSAGGLGPGERIFSFGAGKKGGALRFWCLTADSNDIYVGITGSDYWGFVKGVYTLDAGAPSWVRRMNGIAPGTDFPMYLAVPQNDTAIAYIGGSSTAGAPEIMKTTNGGAAWTQSFIAPGNRNVFTGWSGDGGDRTWGYGECVYGIAAAGDGGAHVVFTDMGFAHTSTDGGATWRQAYLAPADENPPMLSTPKGRSYHGCGLEVTSCWQVVWTGPSDLFACFTDIEGIRSTDGGASWSFNYSPRNANTMYRIARVGTVLYAATSNVHDMYQSTRLEDAQLDSTDPQGKLIRSTDGGATWTDIHYFAHPVFWLAADPHAPGRMYASVVHSTLGGVFVTNDLQDGAASVWTRLPVPPRTQGHPASLVVLGDGSLLCSYSGRRTSQGFTQSSGVFLYTPAAGTWQDLSDPGMLYWTKDVVVDPSDTSARRWYAGVFSGWGGPPNGLGGLYRTTNRGVSWTRINALDRVTSLAINPQNSAEGWLTTETDGLWHTTTLDGPSPQFAADPAYPFRQPERVFYNPYVQGEVWVTSFGGGLMTGSPVSGLGASPGGGVPPGFALAQNYPNPFNPETTIRFTVPRAMHVLLTLHDALGRRVAVLVDGAVQGGTHDVRVNASALASGVYVYTLRGEGFIRSKKLTVIR